ncbi:DUF6602 domain-containing protein [Sneathiella sp.]|uniref:DUF6602 domain-containing protein n=1 Tax=Sneathiella sp. TaxID=1964365 RepID=UPI002FE198E5
MTTWSLAKVLENLHQDIQSRLQTARQSFGHPGTKGDASEKIWLKLFQDYLPARYQAEKAHVVDSRGTFSQQIDVVIFDRQYSPFIFNFEGEKLIPAESVYAVFEAKQSINSDYVRYAQEKAASVRRLHRTSLPIPHAGGVYDPKPLIPILGGILTFESDWNPALGEPLRSALAADGGEGKLNMGCVAAHGLFRFDQKSNDYDFEDSGKSATAFLFNLISQLQFSGTVPMIDIQAYGKWLAQ